jgi:hypothetical protein
MWIAAIIVLGVMFGACVGFVSLAMATIVKGNVHDQQRSDNAEIVFMREWRRAHPKRGVMTHDPRGHHWTAVRHRVLPL